MSDAFGRPKRIAVLGGSSEIGRAIATALVERGGVRSLALAARAPEALDVALFEAAGVTVERVHFDALAPETHAPAIAEVFAADVDVLVVAVGLLPDQGHALADEREVSETVAANFAGLVGPLLDAGRRLAGQGHGVVVVLSSVAAQQARASNWVYGAAKAGLDAFARGLDLHLEGTGARVLLVRPGFVRSRMTAGLPAAPFAVDPDRVAAAVVGALESGATRIWVPGVLRYVMWIVERLPRQALRRL